MYVRTLGPPGAKIFLVGEAPGEEEDKTGKPFCPDAPAGHKLDKILTAAGLSRHECLIGNVARERPPGNKIDFFYEDKNRTIPKPILRGWIEELKNEILLYKPNIVVALGDTAMRTLTDFRKISESRGYITQCSLVPEQKVLVTYHPQKTNYETKLTFDLVMDIRKAVANSLTPNLPKDNRTLRAGVSYHEFMQFLDYLSNDFNDPIALDIETADPGCHIDILGIATSPNYAVAYQIINNRHPMLSTDNEAQLWRKVAEVLAKREVIMHNGLFDMSVLWLHQHVFARKFLYDTLIAGHVCWPERPRSLAYMSSICLNVPAWKHTASDFPLMYNASDAANTYGIWLYMARELTKLSYWDTFRFEMSQVYPASMLQLQGLSVNTEVRDKLIKIAKERLAILNAEVEQDIGKKINFNSPKQMQALLYEDMGLPVQYKRRKSVQDKRTVTTDATAMQKLARINNNTTLHKILELKKLAKLVSDFLDITISPEGKVHTSYNITGATMLRKKKSLIIDDEDSYKSFARWSSSESIILPYGPGNLQNIPKAGRKIYTAPPGYVFLQADYMQAEAVVVAHCINDAPAKLLFSQSYGLSRVERKERNLDIHKLTAAMMFSKHISTITQAERDIGKRLRHATNYSAGPQVLANNIGCSLKEAKELFIRFHISCPQLRIWHARIQNQLRQTKILVNLLGREHRFLERWGDELFRSAYSYIPQSTVGDLLNKALVNLYNKYGSILWIALQLHDAIYTIVKETMVEEAQGMLRECMLMPLTSPYGESFIIDVDFAVGPSWGDLEEI